MDQEHAVTAPTIPARPTIYNGIRMRSRLEARYAAWLDSQRADWQYEPKCFASEHGQYLPDFVVHDIDVLGESCDVYIEVKPTRMDDGPTAELLRRQEAIWASSPLAVVLLEIATAPHLVLRINWSDQQGNYRAQWTRTATGRLGLAIALTRSWTEY